VAAVEVVCHAAAVAGCHVAAVWEDIEH